MSFTPPANYYQRFDPAKRYEEHLFIAGRSLQSAELNEVQKNAAYRLTGVADVLFKNGAIIRDCPINVNELTGAVSCGSGAVYANGAVRSVLAASFAIPVTGYVAVGVRLVETVVSDLTDPGLRDPATAVLNYDSPGALRLKIDAVWAHSLDGGTGEFFAIYDVYNGVVAPKEAPPNLDAVSSAIQKYDRDSTGGTYIVSGLAVATSSQEKDVKHTYRLGSGSARINGKSIDMVADRSYSFDAAPDLKAISSEPFLSATSSAQRVTTAFAPIATISLVSITALKTASVVHGVVIGAQDLLPDTSVIEIVGVSQGATNFAKTADYTLTGGHVDWSAAGAEPAPGSTYDVTYKYILQVTPTAIDDTGFTVTGAVAGTLIMVTYQYKVPRIDRLCLDLTGNASLIRGVPSVDLPSPPAVPRNLLLLATIRHDWFGALNAAMDGTRMVPMDDLNGVSGRLDRLIMLIAQTRLESNAAGREATLKKSIFVDPFLDDSMRDAGIYQKAAVVGGALTLPVILAARYFGSDISAPTTLPFTPVFSITQDVKTSSMRVNPYDSFGVVLATVALTPSVDQMTYTTEAWTSATTNRIVSKVQTLAAAGTTTVESIDTISATSTADQLIRPQHVSFKIDGFGPGETLSRIAFDYVDTLVVSPTTGLVVTATADIHGHLEAAFRIPGGMTAGIKQVQFLGSGGSFGVAYFTAASWTVNKVLARRTTQYVHEYEPKIVPPQPPVTPPVIVDPGIGDPVVDPGVKKPSGPIAQLYRDWLGREPDPGGLAFWTAKLAEKGGNTAFIADSFVEEAVRCKETLSTTPAAIWALHQQSGSACIVDPLAQTFMLDVDAQISSVDLWFSAVGPSDVVVQLRSTSSGFPSRNVLAECRKVPASVNTGGTPTRFSFPAPVAVGANEEVAVVVLCNDAVTQVDIAELGKWSGTKWVTEQPYTVGVLFSSSNAISWTIHQDRDMRFRVVTSAYTSSTRIVDLGSLAVEAVTDLMVMGLASKPSSATDVTYLVTLPDGSTRTVSANVPMNLPAAITGNVRVQAALKGSAGMSPVLYPHGQLAYGWLEESADYITRAMAAGPGSRVRVIVDALIPSGAAVNFYWKGTNAGDTWSASAIPFLSSVASDSGYVETTYEVTGVNENFVQIRAVLAGTPAARPFLRNLRVMVM